MLSIFRFFLILFSLFVSLFASTNEIKIVINKDMIPYSYLDSSNKPSGIFVDYWKLWAKKNNQTIKFVPMSWAESLKAMEEKKVHIHSGLFKNDKRAKYVKFLSPIFYSKAHFYINKEDEDRFQSVKDLDNKTIGVIKQTYFDTYLEKNFKKMNVKKYKSPNDLIFAINNKEVDAVMSDSLMVWLQTARNLTFNKRVKLGDIELRNWFYAGMIKGDEELEKTVLEGIQKISEKDIIDIEKKWVLSDELRYFDKKENPNKLSISEKNWLKRNPNASIAVIKDWKLFSFVDEDGKLKGFHLDLLKQINKNLGTKLKYKLYNKWEEAYVAVKEGKSEAIFGLSWSKEREEFFNYSPVYYFDPFYIVTKKDRNDINTVEDFEGKIFVSEKNHIINSVVAKRVKNLKIIHRDGTKTIFEAIQDGKADGAILGNVDKSDLEKYGLKITKQVITSAGQLALGIHKDNMEFFSILSKGVKSLSKAQLDALKAKWLDNRVEYSIFTKQELEYIKYNPDVVVGVGFWPPFYFMNSQNQVDGIIGDFLKKIFKVSKLNMKIETSSWTELLQKFKDKEIDALPGVFYTKDRAKFGSYTSSYFEVRTSIFVREENTSVKSFNDLANKKLAITKNDARIEDIKRLYKDIEIVEVKSIKEGVFKLINKEVDAIAELDLVVDYIVTNSLLSGIKQVPQNIIKPKPLHLFSQKDNPILNSILDKSLKSIQAREKSEIAEKWLSKRVKKDVSIALGKSFEPYVISKSFLKGIEYDLVKKILSKSGIVIHHAKNIEHSKKATAFKDDKSLDIIVNVKEKNDEYFYSDDFISFDNVAVSRVEDNYYINDIKDLKDKKILAFKGAKNFLGEKFNTFVKYNSLYKEIASQQIQVEQFLNRKADVIVLDKNIFKWYLKKLSNEDLSKYKLDYIFSKKNTYKVAFKDKNLRALFNKNLDIIKKTGEYEDVFYNYIQSDIEAKTEINSLFVALLSKYIYDEDIRNIESILNVFSQLAYIKKIDVYNNEDKLLATSTHLEFFKYSMLDSFYITKNIPQKVGYIKVFFDEIKLKEHVNNNTLIPKIDMFRNLDEFTNIKSIYKRFGYLNDQIQLSKKEREFIANNPVVTFSEINWKPLSIVDEGKFTGLFNDYMKIIEQKSGLQFKFVPAASWPEVLDKFKNKELDFVPSISGTKKEQAMGHVSATYASFNFAIVTNKDGIFMDSLANLEGKTVAIPKGYTSYNLIKDHYPKVRIVATKDIKEAMTLVSKKDVYAFVGHSAVAVYNIKNFFPDLKIVGVSQEFFNHHFLIAKNKPELLSIVNKVVDSISLKQKEDIKDKWIKTEINTAVDYSLLYKTIGVFTIILVIVLIFTNKLSKAKKEIELSNKKLHDNMDELVSTQKKLIESEKMASLAGLVAGVAHEVNTPVGIGVTGTTHLIEITKKIKEDYENNQVTKKDFEQFLEATSELTSLINTNLEKTVRLVRNFKQIASDQATEELREFNLLDYTNKILLSLGNMTKNRNLNIEVKCDEHLEIRSYPGPFSQVITNLIINSMRHGFEDSGNGNIMITMSKIGDEIAIVYQDDGRGIPEENLDKIFEPFFTTNREKGGTGLGLNIIYNIITNTLKGSIICNSKVGEGVEFIIRFKV